jgi:DNA repair protein RecN (Recombination protein N)
MSGETGSGKSAILSALNLIIGQRADAGLIRQGCEQGMAEAVFSIEGLSDVHALLEEGGIAHEEGELIIRRELQQQGKSRAFVNQQQVTTAFLKKLGESLIGVVGQHANMQLLSSDFQRDAADLYGGHLSLAEKMRQAWKRERELGNEIDALKKSEGERVRESERSRMELEEIEQACVQEGEEEELFAEYSRLVNAEEINASLFAAVQNLSSDEDGVLQRLQLAGRALDEAVRLDPALQDVRDSFQSAVMELQEAAYALETHRERQSFDPERFEEVNARLTLLNRLKRKYGETASYREKLLIRLEELENAEGRIEKLEHELRALEKENEQLAKELTAKRRVSAASLECAMMEQLGQLNMPKVSFEIAVEPHERGDDRVEFLMKPNVGERIVPVRECASGGELSRVMLALQTLLGGRSGMPTLLFDEIDANIGGETAVVIGDKLKEIAKSHQVLCITHFPQVARQADHHLRIRKQEEEGRTLTRIDHLDAEGRGEELCRMLGTK